MASNWTIEKSEHSEWLEKAGQPMVGSRVQPDGWANSSNLVASDWDKADFRLPSARFTDVAFAVKVSMSERSKKVFCVGNQVKVRVQIVFVGDCEADTVVHGWMWI